MATLGQRKSLRREEFDKLLPRLYKFAMVLTAHEQLSRALLRATRRAVPQRTFSAQDEHDALRDALKHMHTLWATKLAETPNLRQTCPPEPRLFSGVQGQAAGLSNAHFAKFVANLPSPQRSALYLVYGEGTSYDEAADVMSMDILSLIKLLARGHAALATWLEHRGVNERPLAESIGGIDGARGARYPFAEQAA